MAIKPNIKTPELDVDTVDGGRFRLGERKPQHFTMVVFYRGYHCPICKSYLRDLDRKIDDFVRRGVDVLAVSADSKDRATKSKTDWELQKLTLGFGLSIERAREWGLYISRAIRDGEPPLFTEPGLFLVRPDETLYAAWIQSVPFARPSFAEVLSAIDFIIEKNYPARGDA